MRIKIAAAMLLAAIAATGAKAQVPPPVMQQAQVFEAFYSVGRASDLATSSVSSRVALGVSGQIARICNTGANAAYVALGNSTVTVTAANGTLVQAGGCASLYAVGSTYLAGITAASTTTLVTSIGWGSPGTGGGGSSGGGGGGAVTIADGSDVTQGAVADAAWSGTGNASVVSILKGIYGNGGGGGGGSVTQGTDPWLVAGKGTAGSASGGVVTVQGVASMTPLLANPGTVANWGLGATGAAVPANAQYMAINSGGNLTGWTGAVTQGTAANLNATVVGTGTFATQAAQSGTWTVQPGNTANTTAWLVTGTGGTFPATQSGAWNITNVSGTVSLPTGASTAAKQPALGTAGSASSDVISVQGITSMTPLTVAQATAANLNATVSQATGSNLHVVCDSGCSSSTAPADESAFTAGSTSQSPVGGFFQTTATSNALTTGQMGAFQVTANRALFSNLRNASGTEIGTSAAEVFVGGRGTAGSAAGGVLSVQGVASGTALPVAMASAAVASGAFASGAFASGSIASGAIAAGAQVDFLTTRQTVAAGSAAANSQLVGGVYNSSPITLTNGQGSAMQFDANGYLKVNTAAGAAAGGTSSNFGSAFPTPGTAVGFSDGTNMVAAKVGAIANVTAATNLLNTIVGCQYNATPVTVTDTRYQSTQCDVNGFLKVNVSNANANGQATMANSSPVVIASNQTAVPVSVASAGIASGAIASGAVASGAFASGSIGSGAIASGAVASGAIASGAIAAGAQVDLLTMRGTKAAGTAAANSILTGGVYNSTIVSLTDGQQAAVQFTAAGAVRMRQSNQYPDTATPYTATATGTTAATTATLAGAASVTTYLCGFSIRANATAAATGNATVTGAITATMNFTQWTAPNASGLGVTEEIFTPCIPASGTNQSIAVVSAAPGTGGVVSVSAWGYKL